jgi:Fe-Mn family superoxide dismutase
MTQKNVIVVFFLFLSGFLQAQEERFSMPELKYSFEALEPHIDAQTMEIHYSRHHKGYLDNLNKTGAKTIAGVGTETIEDLLLTVDGGNAAVRNNGGGHYNHTLFWDILSPTPQAQASGNLALAIKNQFVSQDSLIKIMSAAGLKQFGSGWVWLIVTPMKTLSVTSTANQDNPIMDLPELQRGIPILGIDVWEHAYYLKYQNKRGDYLKNIWNVVNWEQVGKNYEVALKSPLLVKIDKSAWKAHREFVMQYGQIMLPATGGDYTMLKSKSGDLLTKTEALAKSNIPVSFQNTDIKKALNNLLSSVKDIHKSASKKPKDDVLKTKLAKLTEAYAELQQIISK